MTDIAGQFLRRAAWQPETVAVVAPGGSLTYRELAQRVNRLAEQLTALTAPGSLIALEASSGPAGLLALLAAGAARRALLPLDLSYPRARRDTVLRDARPALALREEDSELVPDPLAPPVGVPPRTGLEQVAYVMYTSGSTGTPKGVAVSHLALSERIAGLARTPGLAAGESMLALTALSFDISLAELLLPLQVGGTVVAADPDARTDPDLFTELVDHYRPDVVQATPSFWRLVTAAGWPGLPQGRIWSGGEALTGPLAERLLPMAKELWNLYGPTEATIWATAQLVTDPAAVGLGEPLPGTCLHLDPEPEPVDAAPGGDTVGEILLYGAGLAEGYLDRESLTASRFADCAVPGGPRRCYRTGDRGRRRADGSLEFLGRIDQQVKINGHRGELGDIETAFESHPAVNEAVAVLLPPDDADRLPAELVILVILAQASPATPRELRGWATDRLPRALVPARITVTGELPRTPAGKTDRTAVHADLVRRYRPGATRA
ncbi:MULTISPECIES: amino acid adenylation domain-containing protein [Kitasatospora]|uniref:amino acid adenylation domain-containing protein n=1 Tax=Kitasatospora TaxID=2063 RepID=UPI000C70ECAD|nr:amino acid adenylation domain-containing protein [Kitasatospora sp. GP30]MDH6140353.1 D-alanine--poly(phosphoribitol) ligase subunit 1 [Kitasatospora sp. GP30]